MSVEARVAPSKEAVMDCAPAERAKSIDNATNKIFFIVLILLISNCKNTYFFGKNRDWGGYDDF